ncbi:Lactococcin-G-processing and transport ATP-binding protein LagD [compost metagenome]
MPKHTYSHVKQQDHSDCGAACVMNILNFYDFHINSQYLRDLLKTNVAGTRTSNMIKTFFDLGLKAKLVRLKQYNVQSLEKVKYPCIAHTLNSGIEHYIVLYGLKKNKVIVSDPSKEKISTLSFTEFMNVFTGVLLLVEPGAKQSNNVNVSKKSKGGRRIWLICMKNKTYLALSIFFALASAISAVIFSYIYRAAFDFVVPEKNEDLLTEIIGIFSLIILAKGLFEFARGLFISLLSKRTDDQLASQFFDKILKLPLEFYSNRENGDTLSRFYDISYVRNLISNTLILGSIDFITIVITCLILYKENNQLFLISVSPVIIYLCINSLFFNTLHIASKKSTEDQSFLTSNLIQILENVESIHALNKQAYVKTILDAKMKTLLKRNFKFTLMSNINISITRTIQAIFSLIVLWVGIKQIINDLASIGQLMTFTALASYFILSVERLVTAQPDIIKSFVAINRYYEYLEYPLDEHLSSTDVSSIDSIKISEVSFSYSSQKILQKLSLVIQKEDCIAIIGQSGSGKTTLAKMLVRILDPNEGTILINNLDISTININAIRNKIIYLSQDPFFFVGSLRENLSMGSNFTDEEIKTACEHACAWEDIQQMSGKLESMIQESGSNFSLGQKQRLSLARALLHHPQVLICDEIMSNVDPEKCKKIYTNLQNIHLTRIYITHKLSDIPYVNKVLDLDNSMMIQTHEEV